MPIRSYQAGDEATQVAIYNEAAASLPGFKPARPEEIGRRYLARDFDPSTRLYLEENGQVVAYVSFHLNGRLGFPWCRPGFEEKAPTLLARALEELKRRGVTRAFSAYHASWTEQADFFRRHGFARSREMVNFIQEVVELPTMSRRGAPVHELLAADVAEIHGLWPTLWRGQTPKELEKHLLHNPHLPRDSFFLIRNRADNRLAAVGVMVENPAFADPNQVDASQPCFWLGAFGTEGLQHKRINGMFSFVCGTGANVSVYGLDLLGFAAMKLDGTPAHTIAAQVPSDVPHLLRFYQTHFRLQGKFPVFERTL